MKFDLRKHTILLTVAGSRGYGIHTEHSDVDLKGIAVPPREYFFGCLNRFEQAEGEHMDVFRPLLADDETKAAENTKLEGSVYSLQKFLRLAMDGNPNILDALFCRDAEVRHVTPGGEKLREARHLFVSAKCKHTFSGYAFQQLNRIKLHRRWLLDPPKDEPRREDFDLFEGIDPKQVEAALAAVDKVVDGWELDLSRLEKSERIPILQNVASFMAEYSLLDEKWKAAARKIGYPENFLVILDRERQWKAAREDWKQYQRWQRLRNPERARLEESHGYDTKHGAHLFRLLKMADEILKTGEVHVWRDDREEILAVRRGEWEYERLVEWAERKDEELTRIYKEKAYSIPHAPDRQAVERLCIELTERALRTGR